MDFDYSRRAEKSIESAPTKFFDEAYGEGRTRSFCRGEDLYSPASIESIAMSYQQQLVEMECLLLAEIYFMEAFYMSEIYNYDQPHHIYSTFRHLAKPSTWAHAAQKTGQQLGHQWHEWGQAASGFTNRLITDAEHNIGQPVWAFTKFASVCEAGNLGCAATVSKVLQEAGVNIPGSAGVYGLVDQLSAAGWQKIKIDDKQQFHAGDVVFGVHGSHGHIGIISKVDGDQVFVCDNSSASGTLKERTIESGGSFTPNGRFAGNLYVMRVKT